MTLVDTLTQQDTRVPCAWPVRRWLFTVVGIALVVGIAIAVVKNRSGHDALIGSPALKANGKNLKSTLITPHLDAPIESGKNVLWCSTFQLVWNQACRAAGGDIRLEDEPPTVPVLNLKAAKETDIDAGSCLVMSGLVQDGVVGKIRKVLEVKFEGQADPDLLNHIVSGIPAEGWLGYAYLSRTLPFNYPFNRLRKPLVFGPMQVASFGLLDIKGRMDELHKAKQVAVLDYMGVDDFVVELKPEEKSERIILAKIAPAKTLQKTIEAVRSHIASTKLNEWRKMLSPAESIVVPILNFDLRQEYDELYHKTVTTPGPLQGMPIVLAMQDIRFRLDERGAILRSEGAMAACQADENPRQFIFDKPFLILLERRGASLPYFALWVDNPELLVPWNRDSQLGPAAELGLR